MIRPALVAVLIAAAATAVAGGQARVRGGGSCPPPRVAPSYAAHVDAGGVHYKQESFATRIPQTRSLVSFVRVTMGPRGSVRFLPSVTGLRHVANQLRGPARKTFLVFGPGGRLDAGSVLYKARRGK